MPDPDERPADPPRDDLDDDLTVEAGDEVLEAIRAARAGEQPDRPAASPPVDDLDDDHTVAAADPVVPSAGTPSASTPPPTSVPPATPPPPVVSGWSPGATPRPSPPADAPGDPDDVTIRAPDSHPVAQPHPVLGEPSRTDAVPAAPVEAAPAPAAWTAEGPADPPAPPSRTWRPPERTRRPGTTTSSSDRGTPVWLVPVVAAGVVALVLVALLVGR